MTAAARSAPVWGETHSRIVSGSPFANNRHLATSHNSAMPHVFQAELYVFRIGISCSIRA